MNAETLASETGFGLGIRRTELSTIAVSFAGVAGSRVSRKTVAHFPLLHTAYAVLGGHSNLQSTSRLHTASTVGNVKPAWLSETGLVLQSHTQESEPNFISHRFSI